jgi:hypothetical protein
MNSEQSHILELVILDELFLLSYLFSRACIKILIMKYLAICIFAFLKLHIFYQFLSASILNIYVLHVHDRLY